MDPFTAAAPKPSAALTGPTAHAVHKLTMDGLYIQPRCGYRSPARVCLAGVRKPFRDPEVNQSLAVPRYPEGSGCLAAAPIPQGNREELTVSAR